MLVCVAKLPQHEQKKIALASRQLLRWFASEMELKASGRDEAISRQANGDGRPAGRRHGGVEQVSREQQLRPAGMSKRRPRVDREVWRCLGKAVGQHGGRETG